MTCWLPHGDISFELGGLMVLKGSLRRTDLRRSYVYRDVDTYCTNRADEVADAWAGRWTFSGTLSRNPPVLRRKFGGRWLAAEHAAGDFLARGMFLVYPPVDNRTANQLRFSSDSRHQPASEPVDDHWGGAKTPGQGTAGKRGCVC